MAGRLDAARADALPGLLYRLYDRRLERAVRRGPLPRHIGVILDGNRRFARERGLSTAADGHRIGAEKIPELLDWCSGLDIPYVTLWLLSTDNLGRDDAELSALVGIISDSVASLVHQRDRWPGLKISCIGAFDGLPDELQEALGDAAEATAEGEGMQVQIAVGYGGRQEITDALRTHLRERAALGESLEDVIEDLDPDHISANLYSAGTPRSRSHHQDVR